MGPGIWVFKTPFKPSVSINEVKTNIEKHLVISRHISVRLLLYLSVIAITGWQAPITSHDRYTAWWSFKLLPHAAIWGRSRQRCFRLCKIFWIAGRAAGYLKCSICGFALRSISLTVNCPLMFYTLIILFTSSKCASSVHSFVFLSICLAYPHAPLIMCPLQEALFSQRIRFITMSVKRQ